MTAETLKAPLLQRARVTLPGRDAMVWPLLALLLITGMHLSIALERAINWDEFWHYSQIHARLAGELRAPLQTLHASLFAWAPSLPGDNIDHLIALRNVMLAFLLVTAAATWLVAEKFAGRTAGIFAALLYLSASFVIENGSSFRADPMAAAGLMASLALLARGKLATGPTLAAGLCAGFAAAVTIKSVLFAPAFAGICWWLLQTRPDTLDTLKRLLVFAACALASFAAFFLWHSAGLAQGTETAAHSTVSRSWSHMLGVGDLPYLWHNAAGAIRSPVFTGIILAGIATIVFTRKQRPGAETFAIACLMAPILSIFFYHNTAPYFHVFILPPVAAGSAIAVPLICKRYGSASLAALLALSAFATWAASERGVLEKQRTLVLAADTIFSEPVAYFDFPAMLGSYPKANGFITPMGLRKYLDGTEPGMAETMRAVPVPLVLENDPILSQALGDTGQTASLLPEDIAALRENYVRFWGPFWLAGRDVNAADGPHVTEFLVPGPYTVQHNAMIIDGKVHEPGSVVMLGRGRHTLSARDGAARLLWGNKLSPPPFAPPVEPYWSQF
ncbi:ArnT family glycosyltransferase [Aurantiacibacter odishensis]|uniref:ArnT family glycosyltransferase n=1 Tax=Aurantiacibacter odishensis TaxID=1155476 RepID=UPI0013C4DE1F|nr:hypothetical protein [Aurantiacibacter odishensis]